MAGLLEHPELMGLLPMPSWDDVAQSTPSGMDSARFWHLPAAMPQAADAAAAPMMYLSDPSRPPFEPPRSSFAGPPAVNWAPTLPPVAPPVPPGNTGAVFGIYPPVRRRLPTRPAAAAPPEPPAADPAAPPPPDAPIDEQQAVMEAAEAAARRRRRAVRPEGGRKESDITLEDAATQVAKGVPIFGSFVDEAKAGGKAFLDTGAAGEQRKIRGR